MAAFQNATDATEHSPCNDVAAKLCSYATALAQRTSPYRRESFLALVYECIQNRTYDLASKNMVNRVFEDIGDGFWSGLSERQRSECLTLLEIFNCRDSSWTVVAARNYILPLQLRFCYRANHESVSLVSQSFCVDVCVWFCYRANHGSVS